MLTVLMPQRDVTTAADIAQLQKAQFDLVEYQLSSVSDRRQSKAYLEIYSAYKHLERKYFIFRLIILAVFIILTLAFVTIVLAIDNNFNNHIISFKEYLDKLHSKGDIYKK